MLCLLFVLASEVESLNAMVINRIKVSLSRNEEI